MYTRGRLGTQACPVRERAQAAIRRGDGTGYASVSRLALAMTLNHLINHLLSQGVAAAREFLRRKSVDSDSKKNLTEIYSKIGELGLLSRNLMIWARFTRK